MKRRDLLKERLKAIDATHIIADVAIPNTVNLLTEGRKRVSRQLEKENKELLELLRRYLSQEEPFGRLSKENLAKELSLSKELI